MWSNPREIQKRLFLQNKPYTILCSMTISELDIKLLWGRAAGRCSNPACRKDLTKILQDRPNYHVGEMAHIIARSSGGPRGASAGGSDRYNNLILLCPTCHREVDKDSSGYSESLLMQWKADHEKQVSESGSALKLQNIGELKKVVYRIFLENEQVWKSFGPQSAIAEKDPASNAVDIWHFRKLDTLIPNNARIINIVEGNAKLLTNDQYRIFLTFKDHALAFEKNQYGRLDSYPTFPAKFQAEFSP
jgi:5-methylcytosine-specific restriction endonuclease McrA